MSTIKDLFSVISETFNGEEHLWTPNWWYLIFEKCLEEQTKTCSSTDLFHYENLKVLMYRVLRMWSAYFEAWKVDSFEKLLMKTGPMLGSTFKTSLPLPIYESVMFSFPISRNAAAISAETCLDMSLRQTIATLSIPALLAPASVDADGKSSSHVEKSNQGTEDGNYSDSSEEGIGLMQSYISFTKKGVTEMRGLMEDVKNLRIIVSITNCPNKQFHGSV